MIIDIHCDLLSHPHFSDQDLGVRCSPDQLLSGGVHTQVCAMFTHHHLDSFSLNEQNQLFFSLPKQDQRIRLLTFDSEELYREGFLSIIRSIENASGLGDDATNLHDIFRKLVSLFSQGPIAYIGIVWNGRNRFGGGVLDPYKLTTDGCRLLEVMDQLAIPIDLSHCCDQLTEDILDYTINKLPAMRVMASHSNFRQITYIPRNLLDVHAKEISSRGGIIGLNIVNYFVGDSLDSIKYHIAHAEKLGILNSLVLGTDFFYEKSEDKFFENCTTARDHPYLHQIIRNCLLKPEQAENILGKSAQVFLNTVIREQKERHAERLYLD
ncbi:membrane dipeptidase [Chlamydia gallinacea]|uniref:membrane dipeptidase n=1 Tax=Chlamydia gallinacea TaxID=1457153 RepID=UPI0024E25384|nr:membrane dipeptidase [Chlamydia gallinacea]